MDEEPKVVIVPRAFCPRCDRPFLSDAESTALEKVSDHVKKAHPDMDNYIEDELI